MESILRVIISMIHLELEIFILIILYYTKNHMKLHMKLF